MTEYNIFCYAKQYGDEDSSQQERYRAFNKVVGKDRYYEIRKLIKDDILEDFKLEINKDSWSKAWKNISKDQLKRLQEIPEFDKEVFEGVTDLKIEDILIEELIEEEERNIA